MHKSISLHKIFLALLFIGVSLPTFSLSSLGNEKTSHISILGLPLSLQHTASIYIDNDTMQLAYKSVLSKVWKLIVWYTRKGKTESEDFWQTFGGGVESPLFSFGNYVAQGAYTYFGDITRTTAWSSTMHQYTKWIIRSAPVRRAPIGGMVSLPYSFYSLRHMNSNDPIFSIWGAMIPHSYGDSMEDAPSHVGASLGYRFWNWESRILYKRSRRTMLPVASYIWNTWTITSPTALELHQIMLFQKLKISNFSIIDMVIHMSHADTHTNAFSGKTTMRWLFLDFELAFNLSLSQPHTIHDDWKYNTYLWNVSGEFIWFYISHAHIRLRSEIAEYNLHGTISNNHNSIKKMYYAEWKQNFTYDTISASLESRLGYDYVHAKDYEYHRNKIDISFTHGIWMRKKPIVPQKEDYGFPLRNENSLIHIAEYDHRILNIMKYYIDDMSKRIKKIDMATTLSSKITLSEFPMSFSLSYKMNMVFHMIKNNKPVDRPLHSALQDITSSLGSNIRIQGLYIPIQVMCVVKFNDTDVYERPYEVHWKFKFKIQYNW